MMCAPPSSSTRSAVIASRLNIILRVRSLQCLFEETLLERGEVEIVRSGVVILHFALFTSEVDSTDSLAAPAFAGDKSTITSDNRRHKL